MTQPTAVVVGVGAEQGVGAAVARRFAKEGHHVLVAGRTPAKIERWRARLPPLGAAPRRFWRTLRASRRGWAV